MGSFKLTKFDLMIPAPDAIGPHAALEAFCTGMRKRATSRARS
jgi:hypothetical protein